jgi:hypothetical protein
MGQRQRELGAHVSASVASIPNTTYHSRLMITSILPGVALESEQISGRFIDEFFGDVAEHLS